MRDLKVSARIPLQSKFGSEVPNFASFPPGEAVCAPAQEQRSDTWQGLSENPCAAAPERSDPGPLWEGAVSEADWGSSLPRSDRTA